MDLETAKRILKENNYLVEARPRPYRTTRYERDFKFLIFSQSIKREIQYQHLGVLGTVMTRI